MLLRNPLPDPEFTRRFDEPTQPQIPAMPKMELQVLPQRQEWTPPPYWRNLLQLEETKLERACKRWFSRLILIAAIFYILALVSVFLWKLLLMVIALK